MDSTQILLADNNSHDTKHPELACPGEWVWGLFTVDTLSAIAVLVKGKPIRSCLIWNPLADMARSDETIAQQRLLVSILVILLTGRKLENTRKQASEPGPSPSFKYPTARRQGVVDHSQGPRICRPRKRRSQC